MKVLVNEKIKKKMLNYFINISTQANVQRKEKRR